jgi:hypothetical protein
MEILVIVLTTVLVSFVIALSILLYHMFLAYNEVNKRLLALTSEAIVQQRITQEEVDRLVRNLDTPEKASIDDEINDVFDPHQY